MEEVSLLTDIDRWNESDKSVTLMTIHSAKGLEFPVVLVAGLEEGLFPLGPQSYEVEELEEERRLFYVAVTRAQYKVYLSYANTRRRFGGHPIPTVQSRFIHELPEEFVSSENMTSGGFEEKTYILLIPSILVCLIPFALSTGPFLPDLFLSLVSIIFLITSIYKRLWKYYLNPIFMCFLLFWMFITLVSLNSENIILSLKPSITYIRFGVFCTAVIYLINNNKNFLNFFF